MDDRVARIEANLSALGISFQTHRHEAANNVQDLLRVAGHLTGAHCKNLFIKAKKAKDKQDTRMWLVVAMHDTDTDLKKLGSTLGYGNITLRFADAGSLVGNLGVTQGHVSPFALLNDAALQVRAPSQHRVIQPLNPAPRTALTFASAHVHVATFMHARA